MAVNVLIEKNTTEMPYLKIIEGRGNVPNIVPIV